MRLTRLVAERFRNLAPLQIELDAPFVVLHGANGHGKTNTLEAVHLLATLKPLRGRRVRDLICWGEDQCELAAWVTHEGMTNHYRVSLSKEGRTALLDGHAVPMEEYFSGIRAIRFTPDDGRIVAGEPGLRRAWVDRAAFTARPAHLGAVKAYRRILSQKSALLRSHRVDHATLDVLDEQLATVGAVLVQRRVDLLAELEPHVNSVHERIVGEASEVQLQYRTTAGGDHLTERTASLRERLAVVRDRELERGTTLAGPQLDDVRVLLDARPARKWGSRGQVRSVVLSLKLAELVAAGARGAVPLFLLDDVSGELDRTRTARLVELLAELGAQVVLTTTDPNHVASLPPEDTLSLAVAGGVLS